MSNGKLRILAALFAVALLLTACGSGASTSSQAPAPSAPASSAAPAPGSSEAGQPQAEEIQPVSFSMLCNYNSVEPPKDDTAMMKFLRDEMKADVKITWIPTTAYNDKLNAQIAAADLPNVVAVRSPKDSSIVNAVRSGMFWALDSYISPEYPNLQGLNADILNNLRIDGGLYALPRERDVARAGVYFRSDWLKNVGLEVPANMDEIYEVLKAFTEKDPDGNGVKDTTGISMKGKNLGTFLTNVSIYYGGPSEWYAGDDGKVHNEVDSPTYQKALDFFRDVYKNGYIVSDFTIVTDEYVPFQTGKAGFVFANTVGDFTTALKQAKELNPNVEVDFTQDIKTPEGKVSMRAHVGYTGGLMFPKTTTKTEEQLVPILKFFDRLGSDENALVMRRGFEGTHYTIDGGMLVVSSEQAEQYKLDFPDSDQFHPYGVKKPIPEKQGDPLRQKLQDSMDSHVGNIVPNLSDVYISETSVMLGATLTDILTDARMKYVIGELDQAGWEKAVAEWKAAGGDAVAAEYTAAHTAK